MNKNIKRKINEYVLLRVYLISIGMFAMLFGMSGRPLAGLFLMIIGLGGLVIHENIKGELGL